MTAASDTTQFNVGQYSQLASQIASVLAGFAFAAVILIITNRSLKRRPTGRAQVGFLIATICLVVVAFLYADLAGQANEGLQQTGLMVDGAGFTLSAYLLLYSIVLLLQSQVAAGGTTHREYSERVIRRVCVGCLPPIIFEFMALAALNDLNYFHASNNSKNEVQLTIYIGLAALVIVGMLSLWRSFPQPWAAHENSSVAVVVLSLTFALSIIWGFNTQGTHPGALSPGAVVGALIAYVVVLIGLQLYTLLSRPQP